MSVDDAPPSAPRTLTTPDDLRVVRTGAAGLLRRRAGLIALSLIVLTGAALRFVSVGPLWLDEAQSVSIASGPLHLLPAALRHDGAPPLWYVLLHGWMRAFGGSVFSVRVMSSLFGVASLPLVASLGRRLFGRDVGRTALVVLAVSPFAIRYSVEARMYSLLLLLSLLAAHALLSVHRSRRRLPVVALAVVTALLLYTHYYAIWLAVVVGAAELWFAVRRRDARARWALAGIVVGGLAFVPWLPVLAYQSRHTGAPWAAPPSINAILDTVGSWAGGSTPPARVMQLLFLALVVLAVLGRRGTRRTVVIGRPAAGEPLRLLGVVVGVVAVAVLEAMVSGQAYAPRYTALVMGLFVILVAVGVHVLPTQRARRVVTAVVAACGLGVASYVVVTPRTQVGELAAAIRAGSHPGDVVLYCPDQLGPSSSRLLPPSLGLKQVVYPNLAGPARVDWVNYDQRQEAGNPKRVAREVDRMAAQHTIWYAWEPNARPLRTDCSTLVTDLTSLRGDPQVAVSRDRSTSESMWVDEFTAGSGAS